MNGGSGRRRRNPSGAILFVLFVLFMFWRTARERDNDRAVFVEPGADTGRYVPAATEGLGVSIAILVDNSGSMEEEAEGDSRPKYLVARDALEEMLATTDSFIARQPGIPVNVGLFVFSSDVTELVPVTTYDRARLQTAIRGMRTPDGATAIGDAMTAARVALYRAGTIRKHILVVTDGENTEGRSPASVAQEIARRSDGAVRMYFVAFDIDREKFGFVRQVRGEVLEARNGLALRTSLDSLYRGRILAEAMDAGETLDDTLASRGMPPRADSTPRKRSQ
jgi:hypothetical protein